MVTIPQGVCDGLAGIGGWKKQMADCNDRYMGLNVTQRESEPTSNWSSMARVVEEAIS